MQATRQGIDFTNTEIAFSHKTDKELKWTAFLFKMMNKAWLVNLGSAIALPAIKWNLPFVHAIVKNTIFDQFVGGTTLQDSLPSIKKLSESGVKTILDYGVEAKEREEDFDATMEENLRAIEFASKNEHIPVVSNKITGLAPFKLLEDIQNGKKLDANAQKQYDNVVKRMDTISKAAAEKGVSVYFDAEESWIQDTLDQFVTIMMERYNKEKAVISNTYQLYRTDRLQFLKDSHALAKEKGYFLGAKLVRGAYMDKERLRAAQRGYPSPIHADKKASDASYNDAMLYCLENYETIALCNASHNQESCAIMADIIDKKGLPRDHPHFIFSQLYGMSDHLTYNLAEGGFNVAKYVPYGKVKDVIPYLIRRAQENTTVTGDMSREYQFVAKEVKRRGM